MMTLKDLCKHYDDLEDPCDHQGLRGLIETLLDEIGERDEAIKNLKDRSQVKTIGREPK